ncbi:MAG: PEP-CTERM sorting domain-containing protein, partial [Thermoguttaceae bacterium]
LYSTGDVTLLAAPVAWSVAASGSWNTRTNWSTGAVPSGPGALVTLGSGPTTPTTVTLDAPQTVGTLTFDNTAGYTLAAGSGGTLILDNSSGSANSQLLALAGSHTISAPVTIAGGRLTVNESDNSSLSISGNINDDNGMESLTLNGDGTGQLILSGTNTYGGGTIVEVGTLVVTAASALPEGTSLTIGAGGTLIFDPMAAADPLRGDPALAALPSSAAAVPEPSTIALLGVALAASFAAYARRKANSLAKALRSSRYGDVLRCAQVIALGVALSIAWCTALVPARAGDITYQFVNYPEDQRLYYGSAWCTISGTITTDGQLGLVQGLPIVSAAVTITVPNGEPATYTSFLDYSYAVDYGDIACDLTPIAILVPPGAGIDLELYNARTGGGSPIYLLYFNNAPNSVIQSTSYGAFYANSPYDELLSYERIWSGGLSTLPGSINATSTWVAATVASGPPGVAPATWTMATSGSWNTPANWSTGAVPSAAGALVTLGPGPTTPTAVTLDAAQTVGTLTFNNTAGYTLVAGNSGSLILDNTGGTIGGKIIVLAGTQAIAAPLAIANSGAVVTLSAGSGLDISGNISESGGSQSLTLGGNGQLILSGSDSYSGGTIVEGGTLVATAAYVLPEGTSLTIGAGGMFIFDPMAAASPLSALRGSAATPVPEPSAIALLIAGIFGFAACAWRKAIYLAKGVGAPHNPSALLPTGARLVATLSIAWGAFLVPATAGDITYQFVNYPQDQGGCTISGTITTDGQLGLVQGLSGLPIVGGAVTVTAPNAKPITYTDIYDWSWLFDQAPVCDLTPSAILIPPGTAMVLGLDNPTASTNADVYLWYCNGVQMSDPYTGAAFPWTTLYFARSSPYSVYLTGYPPSSLLWWSVPSSAPESINASSTWVAATVLSGPPGVAPATWSTAPSGSWNAPANWSTGAVPNAAGALVTLGLGPMTPTTVTLDAAQTVGTLTFDNTAGYTLAAGSAGSLVLESTGSTIGGQIMVVSSTHSITAPLVIANSGAVVTLTSGSGLDISGNISESGGSQSLTLGGEGQLILSGSNSYGGGTFVTGGTLEVTTATALPEGSSLTIGAGGTFIFDPTQGAPSVAVSPDSTVAPVPEPSTFILLGSALLSLGVFSLRQRRA